MYRLMIIDDDKAIREHIKESIRGVAVVGGDAGLVGYDGVHVAFKGGDIGNGLTAVLVGQVLAVEDAVGNVAMHGQRHRINFTVHGHLPQRKRRSWA